MNKGSDAPVFILDRPQMGENIGAAARVMGNFGLTRLRLVAPRDGWPNETAITMACLLYTSPSPRDRTRSRMPSSA